MRGYRDRDIRNAFSLPAGIDRANLRGLGATAATKMLPTDGIYDAVFDPSFRWRDLEWLRSNSSLPLLVKGIMTPEDAEEAVRSCVRHRSFESWRQELGFRPVAENLL